MSGSWEELDDVAGNGLVIIPWDVSLLSGVCAPPCGGRTWGRQQVSYAAHRGYYQLVPASISQHVLTPSVTQCHSGMSQE